MTIDVSNAIVPTSETLAKSLRLRTIQPVSVKEFGAEVARPIHDPDLLRYLVSNCGSHKSSFHDNTRIYEVTLSYKFAENRDGTNSPNVLTNTGREGCLAASHRALRDSLPAARVYEAEVDREIPLVEDRIGAHLVDQAEAESVRNLRVERLRRLDVAIDEGWHPTRLNLNALNSALAKIMVAGWILIQEVSQSIFPVWQRVASLLPVQKFECWYVKAKRSGHIRRAIQNSGLGSRGI